MIDSLFDLHDRVAVITGAGGLLGQEHCLALTSIGATVIATDVSDNQLRPVLERIAREVPSACCCGAVMDVSDESSVLKAQAQILERHGRVDILINNAAINPRIDAAGIGVEFSRFENFPLEEWDRQLNVGLKGALLCSRVFGGWMAEHGGGVILNIASDLSVIAPDQRVYRQPDLAENQQPVKPVTYSVIKTALIGLTRYLATYWADRNVRVNALSPGGVYTGQPEEFVRRLTQLIPLGRMADRSEYHGVVQFLCSDAAGYMTGQNVVMDGGRSIW